MRSAIVVALASCLVGCVFERGPAGLLAARDADIDERMALAADHAGREAERMSAWFLPEVRSIETVAVSSYGDSVTVAETDFVNLGALGLGPYLPLWFDRRVERIEDGRSHTSSVTISPIWADAVGDEGDAWGVPLLFLAADDLTVAGASVTLRSFLWSLGPLYLDVEDPTVEGRATIFAPVYAGGFGLLLWVSAHVDSPDARGMAHGPLGALWFDMAYDDEAEDAKRITLAGWGSVWMSSVERDDRGEVTSAVHGPLWGAFGWRRRGDRTYASILWIPIPLP